MGYEPEASATVSVCRASTRTRGVRRSGLVPPSRVVWGLARRRQVGGDLTSPQRLRSRASLLQPRIAAVGAVGAVHDAGPQAAGARAVARGRPLQHLGAAADAVDRVRHLEIGDRALETPLHRAGDFAAPFARRARAVFKDVRTL